MSITKFILNKTCKPLVEKYLAHPRNYQYKGMTFLVQPGVFHPGIFFSSKFFLNYLLSFPLKNKSLLELGVGSGFISLNASRAGALVTATDISHAAIENSAFNAKQLSQNIQLIHSDLFEMLPKQYFDFIVINPPYFKKNPTIEADYAWYCGENGEYFIRLFSKLQNYMHKNSIVLMVLSDECDLELIKKIALENKFSFNQVKQKRFLWEMNFIFQIEPKEL
jgi:release factor glutamine methyltransferase